MATSVEVEPDDPVERGERFGCGAVEHAGGDPLVAAGPQRGVGDPMLEDRFDVDPRRAGGQPDQDPPEAQPVRDPGAVTAQRVPRRVGQQRLDRRPEASTTSGSSARMMSGTSPVVGVGSHSV